MVLCIISGTVAAEATLCCDVELLEASGHAADEERERRAQAGVRACFVQK